MEEEILEVMKKAEESKAMDLASERIGDLLLKMAHRGILQSSPTYNALNKLVKEVAIDLNSWIIDAYIATQGRACKASEICSALEEADDRLIDYAFGRAQRHLGEIRTPLLLENLRSEIMEKAQSEVKIKLFHASKEDKKPETIPIVGINNSVVGNFVVGDGPVHQSNTIEIVQGKFEDLEKILRSLDVQTEAIEELKKALAADANVEGKPLMGERVKEWVGKLSGTVGANVIGKLIMGYIGMQ